MIELSEETEKLQETSEELSPDAKGEEGEIDAKKGEESSTFDEDETKKLQSKEEINENVQKRINEITREKYNEKRRADELQTRITELETKSEVPKKPDAPSDEPKLEDFEDTETYLREYTKYWAIKNTAEQSEIFRKESSAEKLKNAEETQKKQLNEKINKGFDKYGEEFNEAVKSKIMTSEMQEIIINSDNTEELLIYLYRNPIEADNIAKNEGNSVATAIEMGKLLQRINTTISTKDSIIPIIKGSNEHLKKDVGKMTLEEYGKEYPL